MSAEVVTWGSVLERYMECLMNGVEVKALAKDLRREVPSLKAFALRDILVLMTNGLQVRIMGDPDVGLAVVYIVEVDDMITVVPLYVDSLPEVFEIPLVVDGKINVEWLFEFDTVSI